MKPIARIHTDFPTKFGLPRQSGLVEELKGQIVFEKEYRVREAFRGLEEFSHIWLLWEFSCAERRNGMKEPNSSNKVVVAESGMVGDVAKDRSWSPTVRPPKLGGNERVGVFATRSPFRPNSIGLSCVRLEKVEFTSDKGPVLHVSGIDLMDGTPIYDIKPYLPYVDSIPEAKGGFTSRTDAEAKKVVINEKLLRRIPEDKRKALISTLEQDPRPGYKSDGNRVYGFLFDEFEVKFVVRDDVLKVVEIIELKQI